MATKAQLSESDEALIPGEPKESSPGLTLGQVYAALRGEFDADLLDVDEERLFMDLLGRYLTQPYAETEVFVRKMFAEGGYAGEDDHRRLVRTLAGGGVEPITCSTRR